MTTIILNQSLCGENEKRAYGLLNTTVANIDDAKALAHKSDLPDHTQGLDFEPAIRGFAVDSYFIVLKTFKDLSKSVRPNRVFTHMLSAPIKDIINFEDLEIILDCLQKSASKTDKLTDLFVKPTNEVLIDKLPFKPRFNKLAHGYVHASEYSNTIVWVGQTDFSQAVSALWSVITPEERAELNFGIYFSTENLPKDKINLICIPTAVKSKFSRNGYCIIEPNDAYVPQELSEQILAGDKHAASKISSFGKAVSVRSFKRSEVNELAVVLPTFENIESVTDIKKLNTLSHLVAKFAPLPDKGVELKAKLLNRIVVVIAQCTPSDLIVLRQFKVDSFPKAKKLLEEGTTKWMEKNLFISSSKKIMDLTALFDLLEGKVNWLKETIEKNLKGFLKEPGKHQAAVVYQWLASASKTLAQIEKYVGSTAMAEQSFIDKLPTNIGESVRQELLSFAEGKKWYQLIAHLLLAAKLDIEKCFDHLLKLDRDVNSFGALDILFQKAKPTQIIDVTIRNNDGRLLKYCGMTCRKKPSVLNKLDVNDLGWQKIWLASIKEGNDLKDGIKSVKRTCDELLDLLVVKKNVEIGLIEEISKSPFANLLEHPNRVALWEVLPESSKLSFLRATSSKLLEDLSKGSSVSVPEDTELSNFIISNGISDFLYFNRDKFSSTIPIFSKYQSIPEHILCDYVRNYPSEPSPKEATKLGKLVFQRHHITVANVIYDRSKKKNNWSIALAECHDLLSLRQRGWILLAGLIKKVRIPSDDWWKGISELIIEFYPNNHRLTSIWTKAGGKEYDLTGNGTVRDIWVHALHILRHKGFKHISMNDLLKEINKDYGHDEEFATYYEIRKYFIKTGK